MKQTQLIVETMPALGWSTACLLLDRPLPPLPAQGTLMLRNPCLDLGGSHQWKVLVEDEKERMREVRVRFPLSLCFGQRPVHPGSGQLSSIAGDGQEPHPLRCQPEAWRIHAPATAPSGSVPPRRMVMSSCLDHLCVYLSISFGFPDLPIPT